MCFRCDFAGSAERNFRIFSEFSRHLMCRPRLGAGIETRNRRARCRILMCRPRLGAGIETATPLHIVGSQMCRPRLGAGIETFFRRRARR